MGKAFGHIYVHELASELAGECCIRVPVVGRLLEKGLLLIAAGRKYASIVGQNGQDQPHSVKGTEKRWEAR